MQNNKDPLLTRFHQLLETAEELKATIVASTTKGHGPVAIINKEMLERWMDNSLDTILLAFKKDSSYYIKFRKYHSDLLNKTSQSVSVFRSCHPILLAAAEAYEGNMRYDTPNPYLSRYDELLKIADEIQKTYTEEPGISGVTTINYDLEATSLPGNLIKKVDGEMYGEWLNDGLALIMASLGKNHPYYARFNKYHNSFHNSHYPSHENFVQSLGILKSARKEYEFNLENNTHKVSKIDNKVLATKKTKDLMVKFFNNEELEELIFDLGLDIDNFDKLKNKRIRKLLTDMEQKGKLSLLLDELKAAKPHVSWPIIPPE